MQECFARVREIPPGRVAGYGSVGRSLHGPVSGLVVGRWLARVGPEDETPWWRVVGANGALLVARRDAQLAEIQRQKLEREGVRFLSDGRVPADVFIEP